VRRWWRRRRHADEQRARLANDVRRLAGFADAATVTARRLGADVPEGVAACALVWSRWADRLAEWARGSEPE
jgi:transposase